MDLLMAQSPPHSFDSRYGAMLIAFALTSTLYGAGMVLIFKYYRTFPDDPCSIKFLVGTLALLATVQIGGFFACIYRDLITQSDDEQQQIKVTPGALTQLLCIYTMAFVTQCYYASRVWLLSRNVWWLSLIMILALLQISAGLAQVTTVGIIKTFNDLYKTKKITSIQSGAAAACDFSITAILCIAIRGNRTGIERTDNMLDRLVICAINRGALTTLAAFLNMLFFVLFSPQSYLFMIPLQPSGQLYIMSVVTTLNSRNVIRGTRMLQHTSATSESMYLTTVLFSYFEAARDTMVCESTQHPSPRMSRSLPESP